MIHVYRYRTDGAGPGQPAVERAAFGAGDAVPEDAVWIDALSPSAEERQALEAALRLFLPSREEASEIEPSSRLYREGEATFLTVTALVKAESELPTISPISFVLSGDRLVTLRYADPLPFRSFPDYLTRNPAQCTSGQATLAGLLDALVDRVADVLELQGGRLDALGGEVFEKPDAKPGSRDYNSLLVTLGRIADVTGKARESLATLERALLYVSSVEREHREPRPAARPAGEALSKATQQRLKSLVRDVSTLADYTDFLSGKADFLLNAVLGLIANEQNGIIKIISLVSVIIMPPTLIASIYGMNFRNMPELDWPFGYGFAIGLMVVAGLIPYLIFKRRGWL